MRVYNRNCEKLNKEITNVVELGNDEYLLKSFIWFINPDGGVYLLNEELSCEKYEFLNEYTDGSFESVKALVSDRVDNVKNEDFVFFSREISELDNTIYDVWLYEIKSEQIENLEEKHLLLLDKQSLKEYIHKGFVSDRIPCLNQYLNNKMRGRLYRKNTTDDITPYFNLKIGDEKSLKRFSELNNKKYTDEEVIQEIKSSIRACEMKLMSEAEFYHVVKNFIE